jgi:RNA polymerase sigma factor (sigma-70 family)
MFVICRAFHFFYGRCNSAGGLACMSTPLLRDKRMDPNSPRPHLSRISTPWTLVRQAHAGSETAAATAQRLLIQRYCGAVYRYLRGALHEEEAALDLLQEFVVRFLRGDFRRADSTVGRFRDYVKTALIHLVTDYHRQRQAQPHPLPPDLAGRTTPAGAEADSEAAFLQSWRAELVNRAWEALAHAKPTCHAVLVFHVENPGLPSPQMAERLTARLGKPFTAAHVRVARQRAREKFAELLTDEVAHSLGGCTEAELVQELRALRLLNLCASAMERRKGRSGVRNQESGIR